MKAVLCNYNGWSKDNKLSSMRYAPDTFYKITTDREGEPINYIEIAIFDTTELLGMGCCEDEICVGVKGRQYNIHCHRVDFLEDSYDIIHSYADLLHKEGDEFEIKDVTEINMGERREELEKRTKSVKAQIKRTAKDMLLSGEIVPNHFEPDAEPQFKDEEDEIITLGKFLYRGTPGIQEYVSKKLCLDPNSIRMFTVKGYSYPLIALCLNKEDFRKDLYGERDDCFKEVDCYRPQMDSDLIDIEFNYNDTEFTVKKGDEEAYFVIYHYRAKCNFEADRISIDTAAKEGLSLTGEVDDIVINMPNGRTSKMTYKLLGMVCDYLNDKLSTVENTPEIRELLKTLSQEIFSKITKHYNSQQNTFLYTHWKRRR